jgi:hypothetical protein
MLFTIRYEMTLYSPYERDPHGIPPLIRRPILFEWRGGTRLIFGLRQYRREGGSSNVSFSLADGRLELRSWITSFLSILILPLLLSISLYPFCIFLILFFHSVLFLSEVIIKFLKHKTSEILHGSQLRRYIRQKLRYFRSMKTVHKALLSTT